VTTPQQPPAPAQLQMVWPVARRAAPSVPPSPAGYVLRACNQADVDVPAYVALLRCAGFETWDESKAQRVFDTMLPDGLFFAVHRASGALAATAAAQVIARPDHPCGAQLGWVAADPAHRGHGLGYLVCAAVTRRLLAERPGSMYLLTDDFRLPAIHVYLKLGWIPYLCQPDMAERWRTVCARLGVSFEALEMTTDPAGAL